MTLDKFIDELDNVWDEVEEFDGEIDGATELDLIGKMDSLTILSLIALAKTKFAKAISGDDLEGCSTVEDLHKLMTA